MRVVLPGRLEAALARLVTKGFAAHGAEVARVALIVAHRVSHYPLIFAFHGFCLFEEVQ